MLFIQAAAASVLASIAADEGETPNGSTVSVQLGTCDPRVIPSLMAVMVGGAGLEARRDAAWCLGNMAADGQGAPMRAAMLRGGRQASECAE